MHLSPHFWRLGRRCAAYGGSCLPAPLFPFPVKYIYVFKSNNNDTNNNNNNNNNNNHTHADANHLKQINRMLSPSPICVTNHVMIRIRKQGAATLRAKRVKSNLPLSWLPRLQFMPLCARRIHSTSTNRLATTRSFRCSKSLQTVAFASNERGQDPIATEQKENIALSPELPLVSIFVRRILTMPYSSYPLLSPSPHR